MKMASQTEKVKQHTLTHTETHTVTHCHTHTDSLIHANTLATSAMGSHARLVQPQNSVAQWAKKAQKNKLKNTIKLKENININNTAGKHLSLFEINI